MAKLINGNGNKAIWPAQDADLIASICGNVTGIAAVGSQFSYTQEDANTIGVADGVIITKEGRRIQLDVGNVDLFTIPTGQLGVTSYYIIGYKLVQNSDTTQTCETFVQKMDNATDVITEDTFRSGATEVYVSLYRVTQVGMNIDTVDLLLPELSNIDEINSALTAIKTQLEVSTVGTHVDIKSYTSDYYTFPSDGYLRMYGGTDSGQSISAALYDSEKNYISPLNCTQYNSNTVYVRKGMKYKTGGTATAQSIAMFVPLN